MRLNPHLALAISNTQSMIYLNHAEREALKAIAARHQRKQDQVYTEHLTRYLQAKRDYPWLAEPMPETTNHALRDKVVREFERKF